MNLLYNSRAHNQRWGIRDGFIYPVADPRLVLNVKVTHFKTTMHTYSHPIQLRRKKRVPRSSLLFVN